jgi:hypothetical protein
MPTSPKASTSIPFFTIDSATQVKGESKTTPFLPPEIRMEIWKAFPQETRVLPIRYTKQGFRTNMRNTIIESTLLQVSQESRYHVFQSYSVNLNCLDHLSPWKSILVSQDIWINPTYDIVYFNISHAHCKSWEALHALISFGSGFGAAATKIQHIMLPLFLIHDFVPRYGADVEEKNRCVRILRKWFPSLKTLIFNWKNWEEAGRTDWCLGECDMKMGESRDCLERVYREDLSRIRCFFSRREKELEQWGICWNPPVLVVM